MEQPMHRILLVDDERGVLSALSRLLRLTPIMVRGDEWRPRIEAFTSPVDALNSAASCAYDLVVSDFRMPEMDGVAVLRRMRELQPDCARVILSGYTDLNGLIGAINEARIDRFIAKPWNDFEFIRTLEQILEIRALRMENEALADRVRLDRGDISATDLELKRLEQQEPGITQVRWGPDGSVIIDMDDIAEALRDHGK
jgi:two-component system, probable response regulator PhcQ